jgi:aminopeptidase N
MKRTIMFVFLLASALMQAQVVFHANDLEAIVKEERDAHAGKLYPKTMETATNFDVKWYRCRWNIDPAVNEISGNVATLFTTGQAGLDSLVFDLSQALSVDSVIYRYLKAGWNHTADRLTIRFPSLIPQNTTDSVSVYYHGTPPDNGFGSFVRSSHNGSPVIWTLSEPYGSSDWWPCKNGLTDKADSMDIFIRTPSGFKAASNGILVSELPEGSGIVYHWKHRYPIASYLVCLAVTNYARDSQRVPFNGDTLEVVNYVYPEDSATAASETGVIAPMIQLFDTLFGIYPFQREKYGHAQFGWGGGMEHQTMTFVVSFGYELLAHELAHQWFGDKITCGSWTDIWLNEGFATYLSGLCYERLSPVWWRPFKEIRGKSVTSKPGGSVYCADTTSVDRIFDGRLSYSKGALILHQLRWIIGDSAFFAALRNYMSDVTLGYGFARTENLKAHFESVTGNDLTWYFNDWYTGEGFPSYHIDWGQDGDIVSFTVNQTQSHPSVSFFEMTLPVQFKNALRDTIIRFSNTFSGESFTATIPFKVDSVIFDPNFELLSANNTINGVSEQPLQRDLQICPNPATDRVIFRFGGIPATDFGKMRIYDYSGRLKAELILPPGETETILHTGNYPPGLYLYFVTQQDFRVNGKFVIIRE